MAEMGSNVGKSLTMMNGRIPNADRNIAPVNQNISISSFWRTPVQGPGQAPESGPDVSGSMLVRHDGVGIFYSEVNRGSSRKFGL
jgi:hypothetical protein